MFAYISTLSGISRLSPHGESGLKSKIRDDEDEKSKSLPAWGEWIEIQSIEPDTSMSRVSPRMGRVD